jgi:ELWxxDGT repeat protein
MDGILYFSAMDDTFGRELWSYDPSVPGSGLTLYDINPGLGGSSLEYLTAMDGILYFRAYDDTNGYELWSLS